MLDCIIYNHIIYIYMHLHVYISFYNRGQSAPGGVSQFLKTCIANEDPNVNPYFSLAFLEGMKDAVHATKKKWGQTNFTASLASYIFHIQMTENEGHFSLVHMTKVCIYSEHSEKKNNTNINKISNQIRTWRFLGLQGET